MRYLVGELLNTTHMPVMLLEDLKMAEALASSLSEREPYGVWEYNEDDQRKSWLLAVAVRERLFRREEHESR